MSSESILNYTTPYANQMANDGAQLFGYVNVYQRLPKFNDMITLLDLNTGLEM